MTSIRSISRLIYSSKLNVSSKNICVIRLASNDSKFLHKVSLQQIQVIRTLRGRSTSDHSSSSTESKTEEPKTEESQDNASNKNNLSPEFAKLDPETIKKLRIFMVVVIITTFGLSFIALGRLSKHANPAIAKALEEETIDFDEFLAHILPTGEVAKVVFFPERKMAVAQLQPGAVINGQPYAREIIPIKVGRLNQDQPDQFRLEVRHAEEKLGIPLREGVVIETFRGMNFFRAMEFMIGFAIIGFLLSQYGRLIRRQILQKRAEDAAKKAAGTKKS